MAEVESLEIKVKVDTSEAEKGLKDLATTLKEIKSPRTNSLNKFSETLKNINANIDSGKISSFSKLTSTIDKLSSVKISATVGTQISRISEALKTMADNISPDQAIKIRSIADSVSKLNGVKLSGIEKEIEGTSSSVDKLKTEVEQLGEKTKSLSGKTTPKTNAEKLPKSDETKEKSKSDYSSTIKSMEQLQSVVGIFSSKIGGALSSVTNLAKIIEKIGIVSGGAAVALSGLALGLALIGKEIVKIKIDKANKSIEYSEKIIKGFYRSIVDVGKYIGGKFISTIKSSVQGLSQFLSSVKRIAVYRLIRTALKEITQGFKDGIDNLYQYSKLLGGDFSKSMDNVASSLLYLKNSLGAMVAPLINSLAPAINYCINQFVNFINVINQLISALTGHATYTKAVATNTKYASSGMDKATKSANKLKKSLIGLDQINALQDNSSSSASGGATQNYANMFETSEISKKIKDFAKEIKDAINKGDWAGAGKLLAKKINSVFNPQKWSKTAKNVAKWVNNISELILSTMRNIDWNNIGKSFGNGLYSLFDNIKWEQLGRTFGSKWNALFDTISGFIESFGDDTAIFGKSIADFVNGWFAEIRWNDIGKSIGSSIDLLLQNIISFVENLDASQIILAVTDFANGIFTNFNVENLTGAITKIIGKTVELAGKLAQADTFWSKLSNAVSTGVNSFIENIKPEEWGVKIGNLIKKVFNSITDAVNKIDKKALGESIAKFVKGLDIEGIFKSYEGMRTAFAGIASEIFSGLAKALNESDANVLVSDGLYKKVEKAVEEVTGTDKFENGGLWNRLKIWGKKILEAVVNGMNADNYGVYLENNGKKLGEHLKNGTEEALEIHSPSKVYERIGNNCVDGLMISFKNADLSGVKSFIDNLVGKFGDFKIKCGNIGDDIGKKISTTWNNIKSNSSTSWESIRNTISSKVSAVRTNVTDTFTRIWTRVKEIWNNIISLVSRPIRAVVNFASNKISSPQKFATGGYPTSGEMFIARERGPELVGTIGNRTAVVNNQQIVDSVAGGVAQANRTQEVLLRELIGIASEILDKPSDVMITTSQITDGFNRMNRRNGQTVVATG